jgi:hypothetical protein
MLLTRHQNVCQNQDIKIANKVFENVSKFKYLRTVINQNFTQEQIRRRLNSGNGPFGPESSVLKYTTLYNAKHTNTRIYNTIILYVVMYGCETWSLTLREEH